MRQHPHSFVGASVLGLLVLLTSSVAQSAGRVPYGGRVEAAVQSFDGVDDPHRAASREQRALANLVHTGLFRPNGTGGVTPALAAGLGTLRGRTLTIVLRPARFHGGQAVTSEDVVQSFRRIARLKETALSGLFSVLKITADGRLKVTITMPKGGAAKELRLLLARPEAAVLRRGTPGPQSGCGPFYGVERGAKRAFRAFEGYVDGRPFLSEVVLTRAASEEAAGSAYIYGEVDMVFSDSLRSRRVGTALPGGHASYIALFAPRHRGEAGKGLRLTMLAQRSRGRLDRFVQARATIAAGPWPKALAPTRKTYTPMRSAPAIGSVKIAFPAGAGDLEALARVLRDQLAPYVGGTVRVVAEPGLTAVSARDTRTPTWDLALVRHEWAALSKFQAASELALAVGVTPPKASDVLARRTRRWSSALVSDALGVAIMHIERPVLLRRPLVLPPISAGVPDLNQAWPKP